MVQKTVLITSAQGGLEFVPFITYPITKQTLEGYSKTLRQELRFLIITVIGYRFV